jgi:hypothetical protein
MATECSPGCKPGVSDSKIAQSPGGATQYLRIVSMSISVARFAGSYFYFVAIPGLRSLLYRPGTWLTNVRGHGLHIVDRFG